MVRAIDPSLFGSQELVVRFSVRKLHEGGGFSGYGISNITISGMEGEDETALRLTATIGLVADLCNRHADGFEAGLSKLIEIVAKSRLEP